MISVSVPAPGDREYRVEVEEGLLDRLGSRCRSRVGAREYAVVSDERVAELYAERALSSLRGADCSARLFTFPPGEESKNRRRWMRLTDELLEAGLGRDAAVVALGGGVTGDLAGFVAATYMRGVPVVQVPTTVLAMLDSSVGGKTGVNAPAGKNLVGAFHHPSHVLVDPSLLSTLPVGHRRAGMAEAVKAAAVLDRELFAWLEEEASGLREGDPSLLGELVRRAVPLKARVVSRDPGERGRRAILNFGHTLGHAMEAASGYGVLHGQAVAAGMRLETALGEELGVTEAGTGDRLAGLLDRLDLDWASSPELTANRVLDAATTDKKRRGGELRVVLLRRIGEVARDPEGAYAHVVDRRRTLDWLQSALPRAGGGRDSG